MRSSHAIAAVIGAGLLFAAGTARAAASEPLPDACALLTQAQVSAALGVPAGAGQYLVAKSTAVCGWNEAGKPDPSRKRVALATETAKSFGYEKVPMKGILKTPLSGVGDDALYMTTPGFGTGLSVKKGEFAFNVRVYGFPEDQVKAKERALALEILAKL